MWIFKGENLLLQTWNLKVDLKTNRTGEKVVSMTYGRILLWSKLRRAFKQKGLYVFKTHILPPAHCLMQWRLPTVAYIHLHGETEACFNYQLREKKNMLFLKSWASKLHSTLFRPFFWKYIPAVGADMTIDTHRDERMLTLLNWWITNEWPLPRFKRLYSTVKCKPRFWFMRDYEGKSLPELESGNDK